MNTNIDENNYDEYFKFDKDDVFFGRNIVGDDIFKNRPHIHEQDVSVMKRTIKDEILKKEQDVINNLKQPKKPKTIMDVNLGDIITNYRM